MMKRSAFRRFFDRFSKRPGKRLKGNPTLTLESLENRENPSTLSAGGGILFVIGTNAADTIDIGLNGNILTIADAGGLFGGAFGAIPANNTYTLDLNTAAANGFRGISVALFPADDILNINGLDFNALTNANITSASIAIIGDNFQGVGQNDTVNQVGIVSSKVANISYIAMDNINGDAQGNPTTVTCNGANSTLLFKNFANKISMSNSDLTFNCLGTAISFDSQVQLNVNVNLIGSAATACKITSTNNPALANSFTSGKSNLTINTKGDVTVQGAIDLGGGNLIVTNTDDFTAQDDVSANAIILSSQTGNSIVKINFQGDVNANSVLFQNIGGNNKGALVTIDGNLTVTGTFTATFTLNSGKNYNLDLLGQTNQVNGLATISNSGSLTLGNVGNNPAANPTFSFGELDASLLNGPTFLYADVTTLNNITLKGMTINGQVFVQPQNGVVATDKTFTLTAKSGANISILGQVELQDNTNNITIGSNLQLSAVNAGGNQGAINLQSVVGLNRTLSFLDSSNVNVTGAISVKTLNLQNTDTFKGAGGGFMTFDGNIGIITNPTLLNVGTGKYGIKLYGPNVILGSTPPSPRINFNNIGRVILGNDNQSTISFLGGAFFGPTVGVSGSGNVSGTVRVQGSIEPGQYTVTDVNNNTVSKDIGVLTFNGPLNLEQPGGSIAGQGTAIFYPEIGGNVVGLNQDQLVCSAGFNLSGNPILYPILRTTNLPIGSQLTVARLTDASKISGQFLGLTDPTANTYTALAQGATFFGGNGIFTINYQGGDGNDVVITLVGFSTGTNVFVDLQGVLNVVGDNQTSDVTAEIINGGTTLNIQDLTYGLTGSAYGYKVVNNNIDIDLTNTTAISANQFNGFRVILNAGSDTFNLQNFNITQSGNVNIQNVFFSFNGGPTAQPSLDTDILNLVGTSLNIQTLALNAPATIDVQGFDRIISLQNGKATSGSLISANGGKSALTIADPVIVQTGSVTLATATGGTLSFSNDIILGDGAALTLGNGVTTSINLQAVRGTPGNANSNLSFNAKGTIQVNGLIGIDIGDFTISNSGATTFSGTVDCSLLDIQNNQAKQNIVFKGQVGASSNPDVVLGSFQSTVRFVDNLFANSISTATTALLRVEFLGSTTTVQQGAQFSNTGGIEFGDSNDILTFNGGLQVDAGSPCESFGTIQSRGAVISILSNVSPQNANAGLILNGNTTIKSTFGGVAFSAPITLGRVFTRGGTLTVDSGRSAGSTITIDSVRDNNGNLIVVDSAGFSITEVGHLSLDTTTDPNEVFGKVTILDSTGDVVFKENVLGNSIETFNKQHNIIFQGGTQTIDNSKYNLGVFILTGTTPTVFRNRGDLTLGINGGDRITNFNKSMDFFLFNAGLDATAVTGTTNLAGRVYTSNTLLTLSRIALLRDSYLNTYMPFTTFSFASFSDFLRPFNVFDFTNTLQIDNLNTNILNIVQTPIPVRAGDIVLGDIDNNAVDLELNAGGPGLASGSRAVGDIFIRSYAGINQENFGIYRAGNVNFTGAVSGNNFQIGQGANGFNSANVEISGTISVQGNFSAFNTLSVSNDVRNLALVGDLNTISATNSIANIGFLQLGNNTNDVFNISANLDARGPEERRIAGTFNVSGGRNLDLGPSPTTLLANSTINTNGIGQTTFGAITNNAFDLTINGRVEVQHAVDISAVAPYPPQTIPSTIVPVNNIIGAGTGGGDIFFNGEILLQPVVIPAGNRVVIPQTVDLKKQGTGSAILAVDSSANTSGLQLEIQNGDFFFNNGAINSNTLTTVNSGGTLGGTKGTLGEAVVLTGGKLSPGTPTNPIGALVLGDDLTVRGTYAVNLRSVAFSLFDHVTVSGAVTIATSGRLTVNFTADANVAINDMFGIVNNLGANAINGIFAGLAEGATLNSALPGGNNATLQITYRGNITPVSTSFTGGNDVVLRITNIQPASSIQPTGPAPVRKLFASGADAGGGPLVNVNFDNGSTMDFFAYDPQFAGGVRVAIGDFNGDGTPDLVTAAGPGGGPHVSVWTITPNVGYPRFQVGFYAFEPNFTGGLSLATGDINGDNIDDIIVGAGAGGGPRVAAFAGAANFQIDANVRIADFFAYSPTFTGGINVAAGDRNGDNVADIITGAGFGGGPHVQVFRANGTVIQSFFAFDPNLRNGVFVGAGDLDQDGRADIFTGTGPGITGAAAVFFFNGNQSMIEPFGIFTGGVRVGAATDNANQSFLATAAGPGGGPAVRLFNDNLRLVDSLFVFPTNFTGGVLISTTVNG